MDFNQGEQLQNENGPLTDFDNRAENSQEINNSEPFTQKTEQKSPEKKYIQYVDDQVYNISANVIHQGSNLIEISLVVNKFETEFKQDFSNEVSLQEAVNYFKKKTQDDELIPVNFKIPRTQINNLEKKGELPLKWLIHNPRIFLKCSSNNIKWLQEEIPTID